MLALDIDGTLLRSDHKLSRSVLNAIQAAQAQDIKLVLATARPPRAAKTVYKHLGLDTFQVNYNGAVVHCPTKNTFLVHNSLKPRLAKALIQTARELVPEIVVHLEIDDRWITDHDDPRYKPGQKGVQPDVVGPLGPHLKSPVTKILFKDDPKVIGDLHTVIRKKFGTQVALPVSSRHMLQVVSAGSTKANALAYIADQYGIAPEEVIAIGDAPNDEPMIQWAGLGLCVENGWSSTKAAADAVIPSNDEDGVLHAINRYILKAA